jgi:ribosome-associated protein
MVPPRTTGPQPIAVDLPITLGQFIKLAGLAATGGDAKRLVVSGSVRVNDVVETRRGHKLGPGDVVEVQGAAAQVVRGSGSEEPPDRGSPIRPDDPGG